MEKNTEHDYNSEILNSLLKKITPESQAAMDKKVQMEVQNIKNKKDSNEKPFKPVN